MLSLSFKCIYYVIFAVYLLSISNAHSMNINNLYFGASLGYSLLNKSCSNNYLKCDNDDVGFSVFSSYKLNSYYYVDGSFNNYGNYSASYTGYDIGVVLSSYELSLRDDYILSFDDSGFYLKYGIGRFEIDSSSTLKNKNHSEYSPLIAFGYNYDLTSKVRLQGEYKYSHSINNSDLHFFSLGFSFNFNDVESNKVAVHVNELEDINKGYNDELNVESERYVLKIKIVIDKYGIGSFEIPDEDVSYFDDIINNKGIIKNIIINGHSSSTGTDLYNYKLSYKRAHYVVNYLSNKGIDINKIKIVPWGDKHPSADNSVEEGRALNRRVEIIYEQNK
ncbi:MULTISPECIES: OmpA family protein [Aliivibrio]|uniref:OmpA family protein n=1 Tax=Aliivibrio finisterrensis TaxID=511998 RepID=A0A4Q5KUN2_9GAMM|nr:MULTISPECIES: OmpA family protein [Aliivibrio]MDD9177761.1 OmpA family protein [Aliivibrio sp. A6]RYU50275.1 OmpA family protein [Aliivibrio finisterrensis]RYU51890.1 OmpA family protein [Aliivibrio finisterrensis]RYU56002.1 OmpA family protein [Aliivibrio finisterrensis]RYU64713.1 OmpA family protein [Aliivibrio finisterrensis]